MEKGNLVPKFQVEGISLSLHMLFQILFLTSVGRKFSFKFYQKSDVER